MLSAAGSIGTKRKLDRAPAAASRIHFAGGTLDSQTVRGRVLVVDDDLATRTGVCELLEQAGYICTAAASFEDAVSVLRTSPPDLLITDIRLDAFNGLQLVIRLGGVTPSIVITGFADPVIEAMVRAEGAGYLVKPIHPAELLREVQAALTASSSSGSGRANPAADQLRD